MKQSLPSCLHIEKALIGTLLSVGEGALHKTRGLSAADFADERNSIIFASIMSLFSSGAAVDPKTVYEYMLAKSLSVSAGGVDYLYECVDSSPVTPNQETIDYYARCLVECSSARRFITHCAKIAYGFNSMYEGSWADFVRSKKAELDAICFDEPDKSFQSAADIANEILTSVKSPESGNGCRTGIETGLEELDKKIRGWMPGQLIVVAGKTSMGKSAFACHCAKTAAERGSGVAYFSLEMKNESNMMRILSSSTKMKGEKIVRAAISETEMKKIEAAVESMARLDLWFNDKLSCFEDILEAISRCKARHKGIELIVIDYLQLMTTHQKGMTRDREIGFMTRSLKKLANELEISVMLLSQVNRGCAHARPSMDNLRESGNIEQDANIVLFIHRPDYFMSKSGEQQGRCSVTEIIVAKNREGQTGTVFAMYDKALSRFEDAIILGG